VAGSGTEEADAPLRGRSLSVARASYWLVGNGCTPRCESIHDGSCRPAPRWPHFVEVKLRQSMSLEASGPYLITNGASGIARWCEHSRALQNGHSQCGAER
jgi:hypothetical protein